MDLDWEIISTSSEKNYAHTTWRARVFNGWIIKDNWWNCDSNCNDQIAISTCFIPDKNSEWE